MASPQASCCPKEHLMVVQITETKTGEQIALLSITLDGSPGQPEAEYFDEAWRCAVEDGLVDPDNRAAYTFEVIPV
jgi:hypothetical protein